MRHDMSTMKSGRIKQNLNIPLLKEGKLEYADKAMFRYNDLELTLLSTVEEVTRMSCGEDEPLTFYHLKKIRYLDRTLVNNLRAMGIMQLRQVQLAVFNALFLYRGQDGMNGSKNADMYVTSATGSGKTVAYLFPVIQKCIERARRVDDFTRTVNTLIFCHTNQLSQHVLQRCKDLCYDTGLKVGAAISATNFLTDSNYDIIVCTMGRFRNHFRAKGKCHQLNLSRLRHVVIDEADTLIDSTIGEESVFEELRKQCPKARFMLFSATITRLMSHLVNQDNVFQIKVGQFNQVAQSVKQFFWPVNSKKPTFLYRSFAGEFHDSLKKKQEPMNPFDTLYGALKHYSKKDNLKIIVFMKRSTVAEIVAHRLCMYGIPAVYCHGKMEKPDQNDALQKFAQPDSGVNVLTATRLLTRGTDAHVDMVVHYDLPLDYLDYVHRCGRTGRCQNRGVSVAFIDKDNIEDYPPTTILQIVLNLESHVKVNSYFKNWFKQIVCDHQESTKRMVRALAMEQEAAQRC